MSETLEETFDRIRALPAQERADIQSCIEEILARRVEADAEMAAWSPEYREHVERALAESDADVRAGRVYPMEQVFDEVLAAFKKRHGL